MKKLAAILMLLTVWFGVRAEVAIMGERVVDAARMAEFVSRHNPDFDPAIAEAFATVGDRYGIRGDIALCQAILETGWFRFGGGTAVSPDQHNYCGMSVTRRGLKGASFDSIEQGVTAMMQHLYAYCTTEPLPADEELVDPRFSLVSRGCAPTWEGLSNRWAMNPDYGTLILDIYSRLAGDTVVRRIEVDIDAAPEAHEEAPATAVADPIILY